MDRSINKKRGSNMQRTEDKYYPIIPTQEIFIKKANVFSQLNHQMTNTKRERLSGKAYLLFLYIISKLDQTASKFSVVTINFKEYIKWLNLGAHKNNYESLRKLLFEIKEKAGWVGIKDEETGKIRECLLGLIDLVISTDQPYTYDVILNPLLQPYFLQLSSNYTQTPLIAMSSIASDYGIFLFDLLFPYAYKNEPIFFTYEEIATALNAPFNPARPSHFKQKVLERAIYAINERQTLFHYSFKPVTQSGKEYGAIFTITKQISASNAQNITDAEEDAMTKAIAAVKEQISYDTLMFDIESGRYAYEPKTIDLIVEIMAEVKTSTRKNYSINGSPIPLAKIQERYQDIDMFHVTHILDNLRTLAKDIKSPRAYIRSMLFNVPVTMDAQITSQVNRDNADRVGGDIPTGGHGLGPAEIENLRRTANTPIDDMGDDEA